jgi:hypothetical protein
MPIGIANQPARDGRGYLPYAFTEQDVAMLPGVLWAVRFNVAIMSAFVQVRRAIATNEELGNKLELLERRYGARFEIVFSAIKQMLEPPTKRKSGIGFYLASSNERHRQASSPAL